MIPIPTRLGSSQAIIITSSLVAFLIFISFSTYYSGFTTDNVVNYWNQPSITNTDFTPQSHHFIGSSPIVVGHRGHQPLYHGKGCNSTELINALRNAKIREDGASLLPLDYSLPPDHLDLHGEGFNFSYDLPGCPTPHIFQAAEAQDLLRSFGGIMLRGDSLVRHIMNAIIIIASGKHGAATKHEGERCRGEWMFDDRQAHCRQDIITDSEAQPIDNCGDLWIHFDEAWSAGPNHMNPPSWQAFLDTLPLHKRLYSPIFISGQGLHFNLDPQKGILGFIMPMIENFAHTYPRPIALWSGIHAPGNNKPEEFLATQGKEPIQAYNHAIQESLDQLCPGDIVGPTGVMKQLDWYGATSGATSYDGTHYSYQVNMEKALIILNLLDLIWGEARDAGSVL